MSVGGNLPPCLLDPSDLEYYDAPCHGWLTDVCQCTFSDIFFEKAYVPTIFGAYPPSLSAACGQGVLGAACAEGRAGA